MTDPGRNTRPRSRRVTMAEIEQSVTPLELFFDLVFVYSITQVTALMATDVSLVGLAQGLVVLGLVWWPWVGYAWLGNVIRADAGLTRPTFLLVMAAMFVMALSIPEAFEDLHGGLLGAAVVTGCYLVVRAAHWMLFWVAAADDPPLRRQLLVWWPSIAVSVALLTAGAVVGRPWQLLFWALALVADLGGTVLIGASGWLLRAPGHFSERHGLVVIIALGESIVAIGVGATDLAISWPIIGAAGLGIVLSAALWWLYFNTCAEFGERRLAETTDRTERSALARDAYSLLHLPMIAGIVVMALGLKKVIEYAGGEDEYSWYDELHGLGMYVLPWGVGLFLVGHLAFRYRIAHTTPISYVVAIVLLGVSGLLLEQLPVLVALLAVVALVLGLVALDSLRPHRQPEAT